MKITDSILINLFECAWKVRDKAYLVQDGNTSVGSALITPKGTIHEGCNIQHVFRNDVHAEVCAISNMISEGQNKILAIVIASDRTRFTPCGGCMDWIMQHGGPECVVAYQTRKQGDINKFLAKELMPYYPIT